MALDGAQESGRQRVWMGGRAASCALEEGPGLGEGVGEDGRGPARLC